MNHHYRPTVVLGRLQLGFDFYEEMLMAFVSVDVKKLIEKKYLYSDYLLRSMTTAVLLSMTIMREEFPAKSIILHEYLGSKIYGWLTEDRVDMLLDQISASGEFRMHIRNLLKTFDIIDFSQSAFTAEDVKNMRRMLLRASSIARKFTGKEDDSNSEWELKWG
jgi:hypothetical protein